MTQNWASLTPVQKNHLLYPPGSPGRWEPAKTFPYSGLGPPFLQGLPVTRHAYGEIAKYWSEQDTEDELLAQEQYEKFCADYADDRCLSFRNGEHEDIDGNVIWHFDKDCGAPNCPWYRPSPKAPLAEDVAEHSLGSRDQLLSHILACADRGWDYGQLYEEAYRVERADRPAEPWTDADIVPMIKGALEKAAVFLAEERAKADAEYAMLAALGIKVNQGDPESPAPVTTSGRYRRRGRHR